MKPERKRRGLGRRLLLGALVVLAALAAGHALLWRMMMGRLEDGFAAWVQTRRAQGWRVEHGPPLAGGWPLSASLTLPALRLEGGQATLPGGMAWQAERATLRVVLPRLDRLRVETLGAQRLRLGGVEIPYTADTLVALLPLEEGTLPRNAEILAEQLRLGTPAGAVSVGAARVTVETRSTATEGEAALSLTVGADVVELPAQPPGSAGAAFGRQISALGADLALTGPVPGGRAPTARAEAWRDGGGTLELRGLTLRWGPVGAAAAATLALDEALQPMGAGTLRLTGAAQAMDALAEGGVIGARAAMTARTVLPLLSRTPPEGGPPQIEVPVTLEDRLLTVARIPVARMPAWSWPAAR